MGGIISGCYVPRLAVNPWANSLTLESQFSHLYARYSNYVDTPPLRTEACRNNGVLILREKSHQCVCVCVCPSIEPPTALPSLT